MRLILSVSTVSEASAASEKAKKMGLTHRGYGRYMNKRGMITHVTKEGKLVKLKTPVKASPKKVKVTNDDKHKSSGKVRNNSFYRMTGDPQLKDMVPTGALLEKHKDAIINDTASKAHDQWAADYKAANGKDATRVKKTKDADWIKKNGSDEVDIANTKFDDLPNDWKKENLEGAKSAYAALHKVYAGNTDSKGWAQAEDLDKASSAVHDDWLGRNGSWAPDHQKQPFDKLSVEEQDKDRSFVDSALRSYAMRAHHTYVGGGNPHSGKK